ncbi:MAG: thioredoxin fold domain-containing protein [Candidatus Zixiibacteriota bacterium]|nr:MAG: thioredoxin fold domain-containing protein [candidate division Zixibacteria bacterium]
MMSKTLPIILATLFSTIFLSCGETYKTPSDIKDTVAWLDGRSALPVFPFGTNPIYLYFHSDRSKICASMMRSVFSRPEIIKYMNKHFTSISVMPDSIETVKFIGEEVTAMELVEALKVEGYPAHYFFSSAGELKGARMGYIPLKEFKQLLKYMAEGYVEKVDFSTFLRMPEAEIDTVYGEF